MGRNRDLKRSPHSPPSVCPRCGEPHWVGFEHICIDAVTTYKGLIPHTTFSFMLHHPLRQGMADMGWVQAGRALVDLGQGSQKQVYADLQRAKEKTDGGPSLPARGQ